MGPWTRARVWNREPRPSRGAARGALRTSPGDTGGVDRRRKCKESVSLSNWRAWSIRALASTPENAEESFHSRFPKERCSRNTRDGGAWRLAVDVKTAGVPWPLSSLRVALLSETLSVSLLKPRTPKARGAPGSMANVARVDAEAGRDATRICVPIATSANPVVRSALWALEHVKRDTTLPVWVVHDASAMQHELAHRTNDVDWSAQPYVCRLVAHGYVASGVLGRLDECEVDDRAAIRCMCRKLRAVLGDTLERFYPAPAAADAASALHSKQRQG